MFYLSAEQRGLFPVLTFVVRTDGDAASLLPGLRGALRETGPALPLDRLTTMDAHLGNALAGSRMVATLMGSFSLLALLLASLGVYATISYSVAARGVEMGVRAALARGCDCDGRVIRPRHRGDRSGPRSSVRGNAGRRGTPLRRAFDGPTRGRGRAAGPGRGRGVRVLAARSSCGPGRPRGSPAGRMRRV